MAQKKVVSLLPRIIALIKGDRLQINKNTQALKGVQPTLSQAQLNVLGGNPFTTTEQTKLGTAVTAAELQAKGYATTAAMNTELGKKQATLTTPQLAVVNGNPLTNDLITKINSLHSGGSFLGDIIAEPTDTNGAIIVKLKAEYGGNDEHTQDANLGLGDHVEVIKPTASSADVIYQTWTYSKNQGSMTATYVWTPGVEKTEHIKGGSVDLTPYLLKADAATTYAAIGDVSMDDAELVALEAISLTS